MKALATFLSLLIASPVFSQTTDSGTLRTFSPTQLRIPTTTFVQPIPQSFYSSHLGFFCKQELKLQQQHIPVTFRLGSMDYCNRLEQKPGYR